jgi:hypothetical protein
MHFLVLAAGLACAGSLRQAPLPPQAAPLTPSASVFSGAGATAAGVVPAAAPVLKPSFSLTPLPPLPAASAKAGPAASSGGPVAAAQTKREPKAAEQVQALVADEGPRLGDGPFDGAKPGLRVLWWNVEAGKTNAALSGSPLDENLRALTEAPVKPHVLALGEYRAGATLQDDTLKGFDRSYEQAFLPYNEQNPDIGILVLALRGLGLEVKPGPVLDWSPPGADAARAGRYKRWWLDREPDLSIFARSVSVIGVVHEGLRYNVIPVHLLQPWSPMNRFAGRVMGTLWTLYQLFLGRANPLMHQAVRLKAWLRGLGEEPYLLLGDMNAPPRSRVYGLLARGLERVFPKARRTFPAFSSEPRGKYPSMQIDHAFTSGLTVVDGAVPPLKGSDHYPLAVTVTRP